MANIYFTANGASPTTAALVKISTGTSILTMLQITNSAVRPLKIVEWGVSFDGSAAATPIECELIDTGTIAGGSMNAGFAATYDDPNAPASTVSSTQYWKSAQTEGTITSVRYADLQLVAPTGQYVKQWPLGREFQLPVSHILRVRLTAAAAVNCYTYIMWEE
jgi:hypothetical protein